MQPYSKPACTPAKLLHAARALRHRDTWAERLLWRWLRDRRFSTYKFRRQHPFGPYILDFYCHEAKLDVELDGSGHGDREQQHHDAARDTWLASQGIQVIRIWNRRLRAEREVVRQKLWETLQARAPQPAPSYWQPGRAPGLQKRTGEPTSGA